MVGSAKPNISHLEAAGGVSGLIKTVLSIHRGQIPPQIHFDEPSPHIPWKRMPIQMVREQTTWPETERRIAGVTALGLVGTNAHVILSSDEPPAAMNEAEVPASQKSADREMELLVLSAKTPAALEKMRQDYVSFLQDNPSISLADVCYSAGAGRAHHPYRQAILCSSVSEAINRLTDSAGKTDTSGNGKHLQFHNGHPTSSQSLPKTGAPPKISWRFSRAIVAAVGVDTMRASLWQLCQTESVVSNLLREFDERLANHVDSNRDNDEQPTSIVKDISGEGKPVPMDVIEFALQASLANLWMSWGVEPDALIGFGVGQYAAACVAGCLCFKDAMILVYERSKLNAKDEIATTELDEFEKVADQFNFYPPKLPLIGADTGEVVQVHRSLGGSYWREQLTTTANEQKALATLDELSCDCTLEIGYADSGESSSSVVSSLSVGESSTSCVQTALGHLYARGVTPNFAAVHAQRERTFVNLPKYPFQKQRYWITEIAKHLDETKERIAADSSSSRHTQ